MAIRGAPRNAIVAAHASAGTFQRRHIRIVNITNIKANPTSLPLKEGPTMGIGCAVKRDAVVVKVATEDGLTGRGESCHGRCPLFSIPC